MSNSTTADRLEASAAHAERLLAALGGSAQGWEFTGEIVDGGSGGLEGNACACGHRPIRWLYHWKHLDGRTLITGSTCVETVPGLDPASLERIREHVVELRRKEAERRTKARQAARAADVLAMIVQLDVALQARYHGALATATARRWIGVEPALADAADEEQYRRRQIAAALRLKSPHGQLARLQKVLDYVNKLIQRDA